MESFDPRVFDSAKLSSPVPLEKDTYQERTVLVKQKDKFIFIVLTIWGKVLELSFQKNEKK